MMNEDDKQTNTTEEDYIPINDAAKVIGWNRATVFEWMTTLGMTKHRFLRNKKTYINVRDVNRLKQIKEKPWLVDSIKEEVAKEKVSSLQDKKEEAA